MSNQVATAIANVKVRRTAHHAHVGDRTVAFRINANGTFDCTYSDGAEERGLNEAEAQAMAECFLGLMPAKPHVPAKKASIPLGAGWSVALRRDEVFPDDPGMGCPAMVCGPFGKSATFSCALNEGTVEDPREGTVDIPAHIYRALEKAEDGVEEYIASVEEWLARNPK